MSKNPKKQMEYAAVLAVSFGFRAAINGGVDPYLAYDLNDLFLQRISEADSEEVLMSIMEEGMLAAAKEVRKVIRRRESSPYVKKVKNYIRSHLTSHLTLSDILPLFFVRQSEQPRQYGEKSIKRAISKFRHRIPKSDAETGTMGAGRE